MQYAQTLALYFERSSALQWYWTIYVVVLGGLLAFSSLRKEPDRATAVLVTILYICFAYKNLGAIHDVIDQRLALADLLAHTSASAGAPENAAAIQATLQATDYSSAREFHVICDVLTVLALWTMERRRRRLVAVSQAAR